MTHDAIHTKRGSEATSEIGILPGYRVVRVHDGWKPYQAQTTCRHALCNVHHLRELTVVEEQYDQLWARDLKDLLLEMRTATERARAHGLAQLPALQRDALVVRPTRDASSSRRRAISWSDCCWDKAMCWPSSTT